MNVLILVNGAPFHRPFFKRVGENLERRGHRVFYALDSHYTDYLYPDAHLPAERTHVFSDYFAGIGSDVDLPPEFRGANLWTAMFPDLDRAEYSLTLLRGDRGYYPRLMASLVTFFAALIDRHQIDVVVYENVSNALSYIAYLVAAQRGKKYIGFAMSRLPGRIDVCDGPYLRHSATERIFRELVAGTRQAPPAAVEAAREYLEHLAEKRADYMTTNLVMMKGPWSRYLRTEPARTFVRSLRWYHGERAQFDESYQLSNPWVVYPEQFVRESVRWVKSEYLRRRVYELPDLARDFFVYPLQFHPESTVGVDGPYASEELTNVLMTAMNLPHGVHLYVKDHPHASGRQKWSFYERVRRMPNVTLIDCDFDSKRLVQRAKAVVTSTSSMGLEAVLLGKPVFVLGHPFYDFHPLVRRITSWDDAFRLFSGAGSISCSGAEIRAFVEAYFLSSRPGTYELRRSLNDPTVVGVIADLVSESGGPARAGSEPPETPETNPLRGSR